MHPKSNVEDLKKRCSQADSFGELMSVALQELEKFPLGAEIVCGPITSGGRGSIEENIRTLNTIILALLAEGKPVFSQMPYEDRMFLLKERWESEKSSRIGQYCIPLLEEFYLPLFKTRRIKRAWFLPGWGSSFGARWERSHLSELGVEIHDFPEKVIDGLFSHEATPQSPKRKSLT